MSGKRSALIVDDSKSARLVLRRMLEKHGLSVDAVESAQLALDWLEDKRPDVIFLDHMMPGMDGFQAIRAIKGNPATATIPVMMYTSKGGDLYLGQARALGAVGVLPKTVAPAELYLTLHQLGLVEERRLDENPVVDDNGASERAEDIHRRASAPEPFLEPGMTRAASPVNGDETAQDQLRKLLDEQRVEIRKDMLVAMETVSRQAGNRLGRELDERLVTLRRQPVAATVPWLPATLLILLLFASLVWNIALQRRPATSTPVVLAATDTGDTDPAMADVETGVRASHNAESGAAWEAIAWAMNQSLRYGYDEIALDKQRIGTVENLLSRLANSGFRGKVLLETHAGEFCLLGDQDKGFRLPPPDLTVDQCEFVGNPVQPSDSPGAHQSVSFANFLNSTPLLENSAMSLDVVAIPRANPVVDYPSRSAETTAAQWNAAAAQNNRVSVRFEPKLP